MNVKQLRELVENCDEEATVRFVSLSGVEYKLDDKIQENPVKEVAKDSEKVEKVTFKIYLS